MKSIDQVYINGAFVKPHGSETFDLINPVNQEILGKVTLGDEVDTQHAVATAKEAFTTFSKTTVAGRIQYLEQMHEAVKERKEDLIDAMVTEYGGPVQFSSASFQNVLNGISTNISICQPECS